MSDEMSILKDQAALMGISHSPNIGLETLRKKITDHQNGVASEDTKEDAVAAANIAESKQERTMRIRAKLLKDETKLIRCRIANMNPAKSVLKGEIITVGNGYIGTIKKFIPFGDAAEAYHLEKILVDELQGRQFNQVRTRKGPKGETIIEQRMVKEYNIEILPQLTEVELSELARMQAAAAGQ